MTRQSRNAASTLIAAAAFALVAGCTKPVPPPVLPKAEAPVAPKITERATLPTVTFKDVTAESGLHFVHVSGAAGEKLLPETMGSGVAVLDYDVDGDQDLFFVNSMNWPGVGESAAPKPIQALYRNDGKGNFEDVTAGSGLDVTLFGMGVAVGDYDNDGDPDLYVTTLGGGHLYRNDAGKFVDVTTAANAGAGTGWLTSAGFFDLENDGDLDLFVCNYVSWNAAYDRGQDFQLAGTGRGRAYGPPTMFGGAFSVLLRNDGGTFTDVSEKAGIQVRTPGLKDPVGKSLGLAPYDVDGDGFVDLAVANDTVPNFFFHNLKNGTFEEIGVTSGIAFDQAGAARGAMGIDWGHFKNDDALGLAIGNFANEMTALYVSDDPASMQFSDLANLFGLGAPTQPPLKFGLFFLDYDLDGRLDLLSANGHLESDIAKVQRSQSYEQSAQLFWNTGQPGRMLFAQVPPEVAGPDLFKPIVGRGSAYLDADGDGDLDVVLTANGGPARLFRNEGGANHGLRLQLVGSKSNRDAIGAKVEVKMGEEIQRRQLFPCKSYLSSVEHPLTFGLGKAESAEKVTIRWPSGQTSVFENVHGRGLRNIDEEKGLRE